MLFNCPLCSFWMVFNYPLCSYCMVFKYPLCSYCIVFNYPLCSYWIVFNYPQCSYWMVFNYPLCSYWMFFNYPLCSYRMDFNYPLCSYRMVFNCPLCCYRTVFNYPLCSYCMVFNSPLCSFWMFSTIHYVVSYWMVVMTISRLLTICTRRYSKETNNKKQQISQPTSLYVLAVVNYLVWPQSSSRSIFDNKKGYIPGVSIIVSLPFTCWAKEDILYRSWRRMVMNIFFFFSGLFMNIFLYRGACIY